MTRQADFKIIPDADDIDAIDRQMQFFPADAEHPVTLSCLQVEQYNQHGYIRGIGIFTRAEADAHRVYFDDLLVRVTAEGGDAYSISSAHLRHGCVYDLLTHPKIVACVKDLLGTNVVGWGSHFFCKLPHDPKQVSWHQDCTYWPMSHTHTATVWLAIDDADHENACMRFISGSHLHGRIDYRTSDESEANVLNQTVDDAERFGQPVDDELKAGEISIHSDLLLHGSAANESDRRRCGLTLRYCAADVRAHMDWNSKGVIVAGNDPSGHWLNPPRPNAD